MTHELQSVGGSSVVSPEPASSGKKTQLSWLKKWSTRKKLVVVLVTLVSAVIIALSVALTRPRTSTASGATQWNPNTNDFVFDGQGITIPPSNMSFITRDSNTGFLYDVKNLFRFVSVNMPDLTGIIDRNSHNSEAKAKRLGDFVFPNMFEIDNALTSVSQMGGKVVRTYCVSYGASPRHYQGRGMYGDGAFRALDYVIARAGSLGVRVIIPLIDMWNWPPGGTFTLAKSVAEGRYPTVIKAQKAFFSDREITEEFKSFVAFIMNRNNTFNGLRYGDDPAVFGWQLGNELGGWSADYGVGGGFFVPGSWVSELAEYLKQTLQVKQLVIDGVLGGENGNKWPIESLTSPHIDVITNHFYSGQGYVASITRDGRTAAQHQKAFIATEFGLAMDPNIEVQLANFVADGAVSSVAGSLSISGALYWSFRFQSRDGGFYTHFESGEFYSYHWPGFNGALENRVPTNGINHVAMLRDAAHRASNLDPSKIPWPAPTPAPVILTAQNGQLRWTGSAGAFVYEVGRSTDGGSTFVSAANVSAGMIWRDDLAPMWIDSGVASGTPNVVYQVRALGKDGGIASAWSKQSTLSG